MKKTLIFIAVFVLKFSLAQKNDSFNYVPKDLNFVDTLNVTKLQKKYSFTSNRIFSNDGSFYDSEIFCQKDTSWCNISFFVDKNRNWFILTDKNYTLFFDDSLSTLHSLHLTEINSILKPREMKLIKNKKVFAFELENGMKSCPKTTYWFSPLHGVVAIQNSNILLVRSDFN